eukprot:GABV01009461.1.p1 GENE.GABV01009461.1~~GABV01009461.1.p1  ORF type:complete len:198 (-),score=77.17 GABV01009461.1:25-618(-)
MLMPEDRVFGWETDVELADFLAGAAQHFFDGSQISQLNINRVVAHTSTWLVVNPNIRSLPSPAAPKLAPVAASVAALPARLVSPASPPSSSGQSRGAEAKSPSPQEENVVLSPSTLAFDASGLPWFESRTLWSKTMMPLIKKHAKLSDKPTKKLKTSLKRAQVIHAQVRLMLEPDVDEDGVQEAVKDWLDEADKGLT